MEAKIGDVVTREGMTAYKNQNIEEGKEDCCLEPAEGELLCRYLLWIPTFSVCKRIDFCFFSHSVCGPVLFDGSSGKLTQRFDSSALQNDVPGPAGRKQGL
jgi:hypothetical protein